MTQELAWIIVAWVLLLLSMWCIANSKTRGNWWGEVLWLLTGFLLICVTLINWVNTLPHGGKP